MATPAFEDIADTFAFLDDWEDRYRHVIELGRAMPPLDAALKVPAFKVDDWDKVQTQFVEPHLEVANKRYGVRVVVVRVLFVRP